MSPPRASRNAADIVPLIRPFDPMSTDAEDRYDAVVRRLNRVRVRRAEVSRELSELERQFLEGDFTIPSGPRRGRPAALLERRRRLERMLDLGATLRRLDAEEEFATSNLARMNEALDRWARETWGPA